MTVAVAIIVDAICLIIVFVCFAVETQCLRLVC